MAAETNLTPVVRFTFEERTHGAGGFARVIRGRDNVLERDIAVKVMNPLATEFPEPERERFRREAKVLASLSHPNIPAIYDVLLDESSFLIVFQFVEGETLRSIIENEGSCTLNEARAWFLQIASALDHAHERDIVHRDVKPDNIIITPNRESAYLVDFGIALSVEEAKRLTQSGYVLGTPGYMSPEQQVGDEVDNRSDLYSLAVTLYEALTGKPIPVGQYEDIAAANEAVPPQIDELIVDCLRPRDERLESAKAFATRLAGALRPIRPLSEILTQGRLHELGLALADLTAEELVRLPGGQRALILVKVMDVVASENPVLQFAAEQFLELLIPRGVLLESDEYRGIVVPAINWAFERTFAEFKGRPRLRQALAEAAHIARAPSHTVLQEEFSRFLSEVDFSEKEDWFLNGVRDVLTNLLANPVCTSDTAFLVRALNDVNRVQRARFVERSTARLV